MNEDWIELIPTRSLNRGRRYYESGAVRFLQPRKDSWHATVSGSEDYAVIVPQSMNPFEAECTCPHHEDGNICKHIAAAMFAVAARESGERREDSRDESIEDILARTDADELRAFLAEEANGSERLERKIRSRFGAADVKQAKRELQKATTSIMHQYERGGFIDWREAMDFERDYRDAIESIMQPFFHAKDADALIDLAIARLVQLQRICIDDSDGFFTDALSDIEDHLDQAFECSRSNHLIRLFDALAGFLEKNPGKDRGDVYWYEKDIVEDYLAERFAGSKDLAPKVSALADKRIAALPPDMRDDFDMNGSERNKWSTARLKTMHALGSTPEELLAYAERYSLLEVTDALMMVANTFQSSRKTREAADLLRAHLDARPLYHSLHRKKNQQRPIDRLLEIAPDAYNHEEMAELYRWLLSQKPSRNITSSDIVGWYEALHALHEENDWPGIREQVLASIPRTRAHTCLAHEGAVEELYESIMADGGSDLLRFEKPLAQRYPQPYIDYYLKIAASQMERAHDRRSYAQVAHSLAHAAQFDGGEVRALELATSMHAQYPRRTALHDELRAAGFRV